MGGGERNLTKDSHFSVSAFRSLGGSEHSIKYSLAGTDVG